MPNSDHGEENAKPTSEPAGQATPDSGTSEPDGRFPLAEALTFLNWLWGFVRRIKQVRQAVHSIFGKEHVEDGDLSLPVRMLAGIFGGALLCLLPVVYYFLTDPEEIKRFLTHEVLILRVYWVVLALALALGAAHGGSHKKGSFWGHAWRSTVDIAMLFVGGYWILKSMQL